MTGQVLMEVADLTKPYSLKLELPEKRQGHLDWYIEKHCRVEDELEVTYILASDPTADSSKALASAWQTFPIGRTVTRNMARSSKWKRFRTPDDLAKLSPRVPAPR